MNAFLSMIEVSEDKKTGINTLKVHSFEPKLSVEINQSIIDELDAHQKRYNKVNSNISETPKIDHSKKCY